MSTKRELREAERAVIEAAQVVLDKAQMVPGSPWSSVHSDYVLALAAVMGKLVALRMDLEGDAPASHRDTSIAAAKSNLPAKFSLRRAVLDKIVTRWMHTGWGMTTDAVEVEMKRSHQSVSSAINYLMERDLIRDSGQRARTRTASRAIVWLPTDKARELLSAEARQR
jgi:hypothetical protein